MLGGGAASAAASCSARNPLLHSGEHGASLNQQSEVGSLPYRSLSSSCSP